MLVSSPVEVPATVDYSSLSLMRPVLQAIALDWELLDPREVRYVFTREEDFDADLKLLRRRYRELNDAPRVHEAMRFLDRTLINDLLAFNRTYRQHLVDQQGLGFQPMQDFTEPILETDEAYRIWDTARDSRCDYYYVTVRRQALKNLAEYLGYADFCSGNMPPIVPIWRFRQLR